MPSTPLMAAAIRPMPDVAECEPVALECKLSSRWPLREVTVDRARLNVLLLPLAKRFRAENALLIVPTLLSELSARERGEEADAR